MTSIWRQWAAQHAVFDPRQARPAGADDDQCARRRAGDGRTTLGRNSLPLERDGLVRVRQNAADARSRNVELTAKGTNRLRAARAGWVESQKDFDAAYGGKNAAELRALLKSVVTSELGATPLTDE